MTSVERSSGTTDDEGRRKDLHTAVLRSALDGRHESLGGDSPQFLDGLPHGGQRRLGVCGHREIVEADDSDIVRHPPPRAFERVERSMAIKSEETNTASRLGR